MQQIRVCWFIFFNLIKLSVKIFRAFYLILVQILAGQKGQSITFHLRETEGVPVPINIKKAVNIKANSDVYEVNVIGEKIGKQNPEIKF